MGRLKFRPPSPDNLKARFRERWAVRGVAKVVHPAFGEIIVPCASKFAAVICAAEIWRCDWLPLLHADVLWVPPGTRPAPMPEFDRERTESL